MIAVDTSSLVAFLTGDSGSDVDVVEDSLRSQILTLPPVVLTEIISDPKLPKQVYNTLLGLPILETPAGYWQRAGETRAKILGKSLKVRVADALIAQSCLDHNVALITRDKDFRHFEKLTELKIVW